MEEIVEEEKCEECGCTVFEESSDGHRYCRDCGVVLETVVIDYGQDWRAYEDGSGQENERTGAAKDILQHDYGVTTEISTDMKGMSSAQRGKWGCLLYTSPIQRDRG